MANIKNLSENIRKYRILRGLTQTKLANELFVTPQTVSKWEIGTAIPDLPNLCKLSEILKVSLDALFIAQSDKKLCIGIDGGGTKTEFMLCDIDGFIKKRIILEGSNPNDIGIKQTFAILKRGIDTLITGNREVTAIFAGISGCLAGNNRKKLLEYLKSEYQGVNITVKSDICNVILSHENSLNNKCITAICGTGSVLFANDGNTLKRIGGWGYLIDNAGSGYDIGRDCLNAVLAANDGLGPKTALTERVEKILGGNIWEKLDVIYSGGKRYIASFSKAVFEMYGEGDGVATEILRNNFKRIVQLVNYAAENYDCGETVIISGGLKERTEAINQFLKPGLNKNLNLVLPALPPIAGACKGAVIAGGGNVKEFNKNFEQAYANLMIN